MASSLSSATGVPPGFRFHPTDEELLLYYLKRKISSEKFDLEVVRDVDLNKNEPWDLQERCKIGATPQNEWYFFSYKDRKYPTGSRTNRATNAGFWKATGRDKIIRTSYKKIGMRKTLVFYQGRAPHGQKTDWIMHEYRLEESDEDDQGIEDGWVICRVFKKKCFFKIGSASEGSSSQGVESSNMNLSTSHGQSRAMYNYQQQNLHDHFQQQTRNMYKNELALHYPHQIPTNLYSNVQVQDLLPNHRPSGYDFSLLPTADSPAMAKPFEATGVNVDSCEPIQHEQNDQGRDQSASDWAMLDTMQARYGTDAASSVQRGQGGEMDLWGYGK